MNILFISLLDPSESGSGNQKVTLLSAKYLSSVGIHCFIAYFKDSEYSSSQLVFDAKFKIDYNDLDGFRSFLIDNEISINKKIKVLIGYGNPLKSYKNYGDIIWFPCGVFVLSSANISRSTSGWTISITGKDKMCLLDGTAGGTLPASVTFHESLV